MKDNEIVQALQAVNPEKLNEWGQKFRADIPEKLRDRGTLSKAQRNKALEIVAEHGKLPALVVGKDGVLKGPLPCGHDSQKIASSKDLGRHCPECGNE